MAPQSNMAASPIHLPALSPRRQLLANGKPQFQVRYFARVSGVHDFEPDRESVGLECEARVVSELQGFSFTFIQPQLPEWHGPRGPS